MTSFLRQWLCGEAPTATINLCLQEGEGKLLFSVRGVDTVPAPRAWQPQGRTAPEHTRFPPLPPASARRLPAQAQARPRHLPAQAWCPSPPTRGVRGRGHRHVRGGCPGRWRPLAAAAFGRAALSACCCSAAGPWRPPAGTPPVSAARGGLGSGGWLAGCVEGGVGAARPPGPPPVFHRSRLQRFRA